MSSVAFSPDDPASDAMGSICDPGLTNHSQTISSGTTVISLLWWKSHGCILDEQGCRDKIVRPMSSGSDDDITTSMTAEDEIDEFYIGMRFSALSDRATFIEFCDVPIEDKHVLQFQIPPSPSTAVMFNGIDYERDGDALVRLNYATIESPGFHDHSPAATFHAQTHTTRIGDDIIEFNGREIGKSGSIRDTSPSDRSPLRPHIALFHQC